MWISDYSMVNVGTENEDCEFKKVRFGKGDLKGAVIKKVLKDEIVVELTGYRAGDKIHIHPTGEGFDYSTLEGGKA